MDHPGAPLKEYQIATEVFGRQDTFDPQVDSMVRVQAGRLRAKLAEYYNADSAADDPVLVELPKGTYVLSFHPRTPGSKNNVGVGQEHRSDTQVRDDFNTTTQQIPRRWAIAVGILAVLLAAALTVMAALLFPRKAGETSAIADRAGIPAAFSTFWRGFLTGPEEPWVIFSNAIFAGRPDVGMRYYNPSRDAGMPVLDHYTGVGEVLAVHELDRVFNLLHQELRVKRGSLFNLDDAKNNDLIFIGSPSENLTLLDIPSTQEFIFRQIPSGIRRGNTEIINVHPRSGEPREYMASPNNETLTEDYSVVALVRGMNQTRSELILAGTTTIGTQAAVEFVSRQQSLEELLLRLSVSKSGELKPFEAVIHVKIVRGVPVATELIALRKGS
ncbi:MAG: hypothetical protein M3P45_00670 [Acidobacteriota bacterium]|nr:hypothetical protein [Acidobacteriota bacterium]